MTDEFETDSTQIDNPAEEPRRCEKVLDSAGHEQWKLTCPCGKRILSPAKSSQPFGRCPKCKRKLRLPGYAEDPDSSTRLGQPVVPLAPAGDADKINHNASAVAADRLRPQRELHPSVSAASNRISAWPLAGITQRALAGFLDLTFATSIAGGIIVLAAQRVLPGFLLRWEAVGALVLLAGLINDGLIQVLLGGSIGKRLVVIVVRGAEGAELSAGQTMLRALAKWLLIPGWILGAIDPSQRTLHDILCGTLVLKGRARR